MNIGALPFLQPRVDALLDADRPLQATAAALGKLVDEPLLFSLCLSCLLPPILDPYRPISTRLAAVFSISSLVNPAPFRESLVRVAALQSVSERSSEQATLASCILYCLADHSSKLADLRPVELVPFPLPLGVSFPQSSSSGVGAIVRLLESSKRAVLRRTELQFFEAHILENRDLVPILLDSDDIPALARHNPRIASLSFEVLLEAPSESLGASCGLALSSLPVAVSTLEVFAGLSDPSLCKVLGPFLSKAFEEVDGLDASRRAGAEANEEDLARAVKLLCLFFNLKLDVLAGHDLLAEVMSFALKWSRFSPAHALYLRMTS